MPKKAYPTGTPFSFLAISPVLPHLQLPTPFIYRLASSHHYADAPAYLSSHRDQRWSVQIAPPVIAHPLMVNLQNTMEMS
jgi:hypothetical protein